MGRGHRKHMSGSHVLCRKDQPKAVGSYKGSDHTTYKRHVCFDAQELTECSVLTFTLMFESGYSSKTPEIVKDTAGKNGEKNKRRMSTAKWETEYM